MDRVYKYKKCSNTMMTVYQIRIADGHPSGGWYRQITSIESFVNKMIHRWYHKHRSSVLTVFNRCDNLDIKHWSNVNNFLPEENFKVEYKDFESVWDFYKHIGYDHKNKSKKQLDFLITNWKD